MTRLWIFSASMAMIWMLALAQASAGEAPSGLKPEPEPEPKPAQLKVSGYGVFGDLKLKRALKILETGTNQPLYFRAGYIEDAALLLISRLRNDGYQEPTVTAHLELDDGTRRSFTWRHSVEEPLPRPLRARRVHFRVRKGVLFHIQQLEFNGLTTIPEKQARSYFIETGGLIRLKSNRIYTPERVKRGVTSLADALERLGYQQAEVSVARMETNSRNGAVTVSIDVKEGREFRVRSIRQQVFVERAAEPLLLGTNRVGETFSRLWQQDYAQSVRTNYYRKGYPDTVIVLEPEDGRTNANIVEMDLVATIRTGMEVHVGDVAFIGNRRTRESVLENRVPLKEGALLDRLRAERGRYRLSRLGIFESVTLRYEPEDADTRNVLYELEESKRVDVHLLFGYGSYELLRVGIQVDQHNVLGRAHHQRLKATQSFKSTGIDYTYTMPELLGENVDVFFNANGLRREEVSFTRLEYGGGAGVRKRFHRQDTDVSVRYQYGILQATEGSSSFALQGTQNPSVGEIIASVRQDRRDNPLYPKRGYHLSATVEIATEYLGGDVNFQRVELGASSHLPLNDSQWVHLGLRHGMVATIGATRRDLPFARRFFPGGENSVRGYTEGSASPRNEEGRIIGAETFTTANAEFEQAITPKWALVVFADSVLFGEQLTDYPGDTVLLSVGAGLRWRTFIGPVRLEYGHNLNPRSRDPVGTIHFSLGFPF